MHSYVESVMAAIRSGRPDGRRRFLRVQVGAHEGQVRPYLVHERSIALKDLESSQSDNSSVAMQRLILIEMLLLEIRQSVDLAAVCAAQGGGKVVSRNVEEAAEHLRIMGPRLLERVPRP